MIVTNGHYNVSTDPARVRMAQQALAKYDSNVQVDGTWDEVCDRAFKAYGDKAFYSDANYKRGADGSLVKGGTYYAVAITHGNWGRDVSTEEARSAAIEDFLISTYGQKPPGGWQYGTHFVFNGNGGVYNGKGMSSNPLFDRSKLTGDAANLSDAVLESELYRDGYKNIRYDIGSGGVSGVKDGSTGFSLKGADEGAQVFHDARDSRIDFKELGFSSSEKPYSTQSANNERVANGSFIGRSILQYLRYSSPVLGEQAFSAYYSSATDQLSAPLTLGELGDAADRPQLGASDANALSWIQRLMDMGLLEEPTSFWTQACEDAVLNMLKQQSA